MATFSTNNENPWLGGYSADVGEYTGPWPIMPPGAMLECTDDFTEVDFYIGLPNPSDPTTISAQFDASYATSVWETWRITDSSDPAGYQVGWWTGQRGGGTVPDGLTPPGAGMHLFVVVFPNSGAPSNPPEAYVPPGYTATGTAAYKTGGGWSAWQTGLPGSNTATRASDGTNWATSGSGGSAGAGGVESASLTTVAQAAVDSILAAGTAGAGTDGSSTLSVSAGKSDPDISHPSGTAGVAITSDYVTAHYPAAPTNFNPLGGLTSEVDYGPAPFGALSYEFESTDPTTFTWADLTGFVSIEITTDTGGAAGLNVTVSFRLETLTSVLSVGSVGLTAGTTLGDVAADSSSMTGGTPYPWTQALPDTPDLVISLAPSFLYDGAGGGTFPDYTGPGNLVWSAGFSIPTTLDYSWTTARWRYWLPNPIVPASGLFWHTVGGHFATVGGATMRILTPGAGWVDVVDGPA